jgi:hypothetical protein
MRRAPRAVLLTVLTACLCGVLPSTAAEARPALETRGEQISLTVPAPGHSVDWQMGVRASSARASAFDLVLVSATGAALDGPDGLILTLEDDDGEVLAEGTAAQLRGSPVTVAAAPPQGWTTVRARAQRPLQAGDEHRGTSAVLRFRFLSQAAPEDDGAFGPPDGGHLPRTGAAGVLTALLVALALILAGIRLYRAAQRERPQEEGPDDTTA